MLCFGSVVVLALVASPSVTLRAPRTASHTCTPIASLGAQQLDDSVAASRIGLMQRQEREDLKSQLLRVCATCNRGFGASLLDRACIGSLLLRLAAVNPAEDPTAGVAGSDGSVPGWKGRGLENSGELDGTIAPGPLEGCWRLVYTNASDVLSLDVNPIAGVGPISQEVTLPDRVTNVIDFYPRAASVLPPGMLRTSTRLRVLTRARARSATRVGLTFEQVEIEPRALLGFDLSQLLPALSLPLPRLPGSNRAGADSDTSPAFFDVLYLDQEMLIIQQNEPGGVFVAVRESAEELRLRSDPNVAAMS